MTAVHDTIQPPGPGDSDAVAGASCDAGNKMAAPGRTDLSVHRPPNRGPRECEWKPGGGSRVAEGGREARTEYETLEAFGGFAWMKLRPKTGRRHQIRAHMAHIGHPLAVDRVHAGKRQLKLKDLRPDLPATWKNPVVLDRQPLHASELVLRHPRTGEEMRFTAPLPPDLAEVLRLLRESNGSR